MKQMMGAFAELDRENILENTRRGQKSKAMGGGWTGGPTPFGYRKGGAEAICGFSRGRGNHHRPWSFPDLM